MEMEKSKVLIQFFLIFRQSGDVLFFLYARRLRGYTATDASYIDVFFKIPKCPPFKIFRNGIQKIDYKQSNSFFALTSTMMPSLKPYNNNFPLSEKSIAS